LIGHAFADMHGELSGHLFYICNASSDAVAFKLPPALRNVQWQVVFDTTRWRAHDHAQRQINGDSYTLAAHSSALLADGYAPASLHGTRES
jgi:hypothetical protein